MDGRPGAVFTIARGSSDAAAAFAAYRISLLSGIPVGSFTPSLATVHRYVCATNDVAALAFSQSGASPDLAEAIQAFAKGGRWAVTNSPDSALARAASLHVELCAGEERSVAATKSFICSLAVAEVFAWALSGRTAPDGTGDAIGEVSLGALERPADLGFLVDTRSAYVLGRGSTLPVAVEAALKLKELAGVHAEAVSAAEVMHGPKTLAGEDMPVLYFAGPGKSGQEVSNAAQILGGLGSPVRGIFAEQGDDELRAAIRMVSSFYQALPELAVARGRDPDSPRALNKVTLTS